MMQDLHQAVSDLDCTMAHLKSRRMVLDNAIKFVEQQERLGHHVDVSGHTGDTLFMAVELVVDGDASVQDVSHNDAPSSAASAPDDVAVAAPVDEPAPESEPEPEPAPEPEPEPEPLVRNLPAAKDNKWTDAQVDKLRSMVDVGAPNIKIAKQLGRSIKSVQNKVRRLGLRRKPKPDALPLRSVPSRRARAAVPVQVRTPKQLQSVVDHLDAVGNTPFWTPARDFILGKSCKDGLAPVAVGKAVGADPADAMARWELLCVNRNVTAHVHNLVLALRLRAEAAE